MTSSQIQLKRTRAMLKKHNLFYLIGSASIVALDQISKIWALNWARHILSGETPSLSQGILLEKVLPFFNWVFVWNQGVSFGFLNYPNVADIQSYLLAGFAGLVSIIFGIWFFKSQQRNQKIALLLIISGAIGNIIDRLQFGAVIDFLDFHYASYHWPAFNIADISLTFGAILFVWHGLRDGHKNSKKD